MFGSLDASQNSHKLIRNYNYKNIYDEWGYRDFHEVIYIKHKEHDDEEDYIEINQFDNEFYSTYQKVFHKMFPDPEFEDMDMNIY